MWLTQGEVMQVELGESLAGSEAEVLEDIEVVGWGPVRGRRILAGCGEDAREYKAECGRETHEIPLALEIHFRGMKQTYPRRPWVKAGSDSG